MQAKQRLCSTHLVQLLPIPALHFSETLATQHLTATITNSSFQFGNQWPRLLPATVGPLLFSFMNLIGYSQHLDFFVTPY